MRQQITYKDQPIDLVLTNLCSYEDHGDYELFPSAPLDLPFADMVGQIREEGHLLKAATNRLLLFQWNDVEITLYSSGRMILENIRPNTYHVAMALGQRIIQMSKTGSDINK